MEPPRCDHCGFASRNGDKATGRCQNAMNENYARPLWAVQSCTHPVTVQHVSQPAEAAK